MMKSSFKIILSIFIAFLGSIQISYGGQHLYTSDCGYQNSNEAMATLDLGPWFDSFEDCLKNQPEYKAFISALSTNFRNNQNIKCTFEISKDGRLANLKLVSSSGTGDIDNKFLSMIEKVKFNKPENNLPEVRGIETEFWKEGNKIHFWSQLNRNTRSIAYKFVNYSGPEILYPCKSRTKELEKGLFRGSFGSKLAE